MYTDFLFVLLVAQILLVVAVDHLQKAPLHLTVHEFLLVADPPQMMKHVWPIRAPTVQE